MKSESDIKDKLARYEGMLTGLRAAKGIDRPGVFLAVERVLPGQGVAGLRSTVELDKALKGFPPEDQQGIQQAFADYVQHMPDFLEGRICILKWVLDEGNLPG